MRLIIAFVVTALAICSADAADLVKLRTACEEANKLSEEYPDLAEGLSESALVQNYCLLLRVPDDFPPASPGRIACAKQAQYLTREMLRRGLPLLSVC